MTRKNYSLIPVLAAIIMIPQFLFWWLAPATAAARLAVYIGGTALTVGIPLACFLTYWNSSLRKSAGLFVVCSVLEIAVVSLAALLLGFDVSVRSAVFAFVITTLVCLIALLPLISAALKQQRQGVYSAAISAEPSNPPMREIQDHSDRVPSVHPHNSMSSRMPHQAPINKPLPPRNR